jgi:IS5 family transposase
MGSKQLGFREHELNTVKKRTKREKFLALMEAMVPGQALINLIEPHYPKTSKKVGRPPYPLDTYPLASAKHCCAYTCCSSGIS